MSGLVESRRYSDVFYSIEDSGNGNSVYVISKNGTVVGNNDMILPSSLIFFIWITYRQKYQYSLVNSVFCINLNHEGEITLEDVRNYDFEDIALSSGTKNGDELIFVGDIGNDWPNHCQGVNQTKRMVHVFSEPDLNEYR